MTRPRKLTRLTFRPKLGDETARHIRDAIMSGIYKPGEKLPVYQIALEIGVSTMPVREALIALAQEGLVDGMPRRGFQVGEIRSRDIEDVFTLHAFLAGIMAERAAAVIPGATLVSIANVQEQIGKVSRSRMAHREKAARVEELNYAFHRAINLSVDAPRLRWFLRSTSRYVPRRFYETVPGWVATTVDDHPGILKALESRDGSLARRLMEEHVLRGGQHVIDQFKQQMSAPGR